MPDTIGGVAPALGALVAPLVHQFIRSFVPASWTSEAHPANGTPPDTAGKPPLWRSRPETDEASLGTGWFCRGFAKVGGLLRRFGQAGRYRKLGKWFKIKEAQNVGA